MDEDALNDLKIRINNFQVELQMHEVSRKNVVDTLNTVIPQLMEMHKKTLEKVERGEINIEVYETMENESRQKVAAMEQTLIDGAFMADKCSQHIKKLEEELNSSIQQNKSDGLIGSEEFGGNPDGKERYLGEFSLEPTVIPTGTPTPLNLTYDKSMALPDDAFHFTDRKSGGKRKPKKKKRRKKKRKTKRRKKKRKTKRRKTKRKTRRRN
jgi:hypothetical protein